MYRTTQPQEMEQAFRNRKIFIILALYIGAIFFTSNSLAYRLTLTLFPGFASAVPPGSGLVERWLEREVRFRVNNTGAGDGVTFDQTQEAIANAFQSWEDVSCSDLKFVYDGGTDATRDANDGINTSYWTESGGSAHNGPAALFPGSRMSLLAVALVTVAENGRIIDVDIAFNGGDYIWSNTGEVSIEGVAAHEIGHLLGLAHSELTTLPAPTMKSSFPQGTSFQQASLEKDDKNGACYLYQTVTGSSSQAAGDFNGDGYLDLAIGVPGETVGTKLNAGAVNVIYGSPSGLNAAGNQLLHQDLTHIDGAAETEDRFGAALAIGDFNGDGYDDLAIGAPNDTVVNPAGVTVVGAGVVNVIYGSATGLNAATSQLWHQDIGGIEDVAEADDHYGAALGAGDFNNDGFDDLAIGIPNEAIGNLAGAGAVNVIYGAGSIGLRDAGNQLWHQDVADIEEVAETGDQFGASIAVGDFNNDGNDDLAVGVPKEDIGNVADAGAVNVFYGTSVGLNVSNNQLWHQDIANIEGVSETGDLFGSSLTAGDFNNDGRHDLAIGAPNSTIVNAAGVNLAGAGVVNVIYGAASGLSASNNQLWHQDIANIEEVAEANDQFGATLSTGDFNSDGHDDLAIGVPKEAIGNVSAAGAVNIIYGAASGLSASGNQVWHQDSAGIEDAVGQNDQFGAALISGDFNGDGADDLAVGVSHETVGTIVEAGAVNTIYGSVTGLSENGNQLWHQDIDGIEGVCEENNRFGSAL